MGYGAFWTLGQCWVSKRPGTDQMFKNMVLGLDVSIQLHAKLSASVETCAQAANQAARAGAPPVPSPDVSHATGSFTVRLTGGETVVFWLNEEKLVASVLDAVSGVRRWCRFLYVVFDGPLVPPMKAEFEGKRRESAKKTAQKNLANDDKVYPSLDAARADVLRVVRWSPRVLSDLQSGLKKMNVAWILSPAEADAQLHYMFLKEIIDCAISTDGDFLVRGVTTYDLVRSRIFLITPSDKDQETDDFVMVMRAGLTKAVHVLTRSDYSAGIAGLSSKALLPFAAKMIKSKKWTRATPIAVMIANIRESAEDSLRVRKKQAESNFCELAYVNAMWAYDYQPVLDFEGGIFRSHETLNVNTSPGQSCGPAVTFSRLGKVGAGLKVGHPQVDLFLGREGHRQRVVALVSENDVTLVQHIEQLIALDCVAVRRSAKVHFSNPLDASVRADAQVDFVRVPVLVVAPGVVGQLGVLRVVDGKLGCVNCESVRRTIRRLQRLGRVGPHRNLRLGNRVGRDDGRKVCIKHAK